LTDEDALVPHRRLETRAPAPRVLHESLSRGRTPFGVARRS
jgi:hypothetical protein